MLSWLFYFYLGPCMKQFLQMQWVSDLPFYRLFTWSIREPLGTKLYLLVHSISKRDCITADISTYNVISYKLWFCFVSTIWCIEVTLSNYLNAIQEMKLFTQKDIGNKRAKDWPLRNTVKVLLTWPKNLNKVNNFKNK